MDNNIKNQIKRTLFVPAGIAVVVVPYSLLIGWNLMTLALFWFFIVPALAVYLPRLASKNNSHLLESVAGLLIFYGIMAFMIYDHYKTDYFKIMILSCFLNIILISSVTWARNQQAVKKY
jgi:hypothetical protein